MVRFWGVCTFRSSVPSKPKSLDSPLQARGVVTRHDGREFLDCSPHLETDIHCFVYFEVDFCARFHGPFNRLTYAAPALESRRHSSTSSQCRLHKHLACFLEVACRHCRNWSLRCLLWPNRLALSITLLTLINSSILGSCDNLLSILESCANVEVLTLFNAIPDESSSTPGPSSDLPSDWHVHASFPFTTCPSVLTKSQTYPVFPFQA